jgi:N-acetylglutamate synthase-like GNAT family acetyltransferase
VDTDTRPYNREDYAACRLLWAELTEYHRTICDSPEIGGDDPGADFDEFMADRSRAGVWVATRDQTIVGLAGLLVDGAEGELEPVVVSVTCRGQGVGRRLIETVIGQATTQGLRSLKVRPVARNADAMRVFRKSGFGTLGHVELFMNLGESRTEWNEGIEIHGESYNY